MLNHRNRESFSSGYKPSTKKSAFDEKIKRRNTVDVVPVSQKSSDLNVFPRRKITHPLPDSLINISKKPMIFKKYPRIGDRTDVLLSKGKILNIH